MVSVGVNDFQMSDLNKPESKRMVRYLSAIINFLKFRGERRAKFDEYDTEFVRRIRLVLPASSWKVAIALLTTHPRYSGRTGRTEE